VRLGAKLTALVVTLVVCSALGVGLIAITISHRIELTSLEAPLRTVDAVGESSSTNALANVLDALQAANVDATAVVVGPQSKATTLLTSSPLFQGVLTVSDARESLRKISRSRDVGDAVYTSVDIGAGQYLVVLIGTASASRHEHELEWLTVVVALLLCALCILLSRRILRPDIAALQELEKYAGRVTAGDLTADSPERGGSGEIVQLRSEFLAMVAALQVRLQREVDVSSAMQQFVGDASHELRTPLTVIKGTNDLLLESSGLGAVEAERLASNAKEIDRMSRLIDDLLYLAKMGQLITEPMVLMNLSLVAREELRRFEPFFSQRKVTQIIDEDVMLQANESYVRRIISNAVSNIIGYTSETDPVVFRVTRSGDEVILVIEDGGPGLPRYDETPTRFQRFDAARNRAHGGSGLGLSIMHDATRRMGGAMTMSRSSLGGLALEFRFPGPPN